MDAVTSQYTKLQSAISRYNSTQNKSNSYQSDYNSTFDQYISSLNGANSSFSGYIKYLVSAKASTIALSAATAAMKMAISAGISIAISALVTQISKWINAQDEARQKAVELSNTYNEQQTSLDSQINKYKELKSTLDKGNLSADESRSIKEQLLEIQNSLIDSYGNEVSNLDLVNGKYKEQLGLLTSLSKEKATEHTILNRDAFEEAKKALTKTKTYNISQMFTRPFYSALTDEQNKLKDFINNYNSAIKLVSHKTGIETGVSGAITKGSTLQIQGDAETVNNLLKQFSEDLRLFGEENEIDVTDITSDIASQLRNIWTDDLIEHKKNYDEFINAEIIRNDTLRPLYKDSIQAVEDYNAALLSGKGVTEAKEKLDSLKESVQNASVEVEGSSDVFNDIFNSVNKSSEIAYSIDVSLKKDTIAQNYAEQLRGLSDFDLESFNLDDNFIAPGEEAYNSLINLLGLSKDDTQLLIDKLVELGYIQGEVTDEISSKTPSTISDSISQISSQIKPQFNALSDAYQKIFTPDGFSRDNIDFDLLESIQSAFTNIDDELSINFDTSVLDDFLSILNNSESTAEEVKQAFDDLATSYLFSTDVMKNLNSETVESVESQLAKMGVTNAETVATELLASKEEALALQAEALAITKDGITSASEAQISALLAEADASAGARAYLLQLAATEQIFNNQNLDTSGKVSELGILAAAYGETAFAAKIAAMEKAAEESHTVFNPSESDLAKLQEEFYSLLFKKYKVNFGVSSNNKGNSTASKEAEDANITAFEEQSKKLKDLKDRNLLNEKQYLDAFRALYERYFKGNEKYIDEYNKYQKEYLDGMRDLYESVISDVVKQIDKQIDSLNDQKDAAVDSLKSQQEAAKEALEAQKDAIEEQIKLIDKQIDSKQAQIDAINEENEARENAINLEKEQYELERLRNQRTEYVYSGKDKGFIYQTDTGAIRDQEQAVKEAEDQIRIADIEKEISLLEKKKEVLEEQQDAISEQIDRVDEYYEQLISNTESYWDAQIDGAEETKSRWEELQELQEEMEMNARLLSIGISQEDIENLSNDELLERVREKYLGILSDIYAGNKEMLSSLSDLTGIDVSALPSFLQDTQGYMDILSQGVDFANLNDSLGIVIDQFANVAAAAGQMTGSVIGSTGIHFGTNTDTKTSAGTGDVSFIDAVKQLENESVPVINNVADAFAGEESSEDSSQSIVGSVNKAKAAIAGSSSGKKDSSEGSEGNGEDSGSLLEAMAAQSQAALDEETGIPAQIQKWQELNNVLSAILSNLMNIAAVISTMNATETSINSGSPLGPALAKGGVSHGTRNAMVSEYNQLETIIHKNGTYEITSSPTLTDLSPGDQVLNNSQTLALIREKREASARGTNGVFLGDTHSVLSSVPELQLHNTILDNSLASMASMQLLGNDNKNSLINVSIGDVILENVQNADTLSKQIVMRLPTQIKQELSKRG